MKGDKYRRYNKHLYVTITRTRKCDYPFKLLSQPVHNCGGWIVNMWNHNHELANTLVGYSYVDRLKPNECSMVVYMTKFSEACKRCTYFEREH